MTLGFIGLGKMGGQIVSKLLADGHNVVIFDINPGAVETLVSLGAQAAVSKTDLLAKLGERPVVWLMIPSQYVTNEITQLASIMPKNSLVIDGGNSNYQNSISNASLLKNNDINMLDIGTSGGIMGFDNGFCMMVGGDIADYDYIEPILKTLSAPSGGYAYMGPSGYGHYVKMIHNAIEYGMMQAISEGYEMLYTGPMSNIPMSDVAKVWQQGSIVNSKLNELAYQVLKENPDLPGIDGYVADSGEGEWALNDATKNNIKMPVLQQSLQVRKDSQAGQVSYATKMLAALRNKFGGHNINKT